MQLVAASVIKLRHTIMLEDESMRQRFDGVESLPHGHHSARLLDECTIFVSNGEAGIEKLSTRSGCSFKRK